MATEGLICWPTPPPQHITQLTPMEAWLTMVYYSVQIFADFAGYSSIAIGLAYMMGLRFPRNFNYPYLSRGFSEFWSRWHMTLSTWLRPFPSYRWRSFTLPSSCRRRRSCPCPSRAPGHWPRRWWWGAPPGMPEDGEPLACCFMSDGY